MKLFFNHEIGFGKMQKQSFFYAPFAAFFEPQERESALENGWFPLNNDIWFQSRSTRLNLDVYKPTKKIVSLSKKIKYYPHLTLTENKKKILNNIYQKYMEKKKFSVESSLSINDILGNSHGCIYYTYEDNIIAFCFYKIISSNFLSVEFAWDYAEPTLSLGHINIYISSLLAKQHRCKYMYLSAGYEKCSIYKSQYPGFEWWKGYEWSNDVETYKKLCLADEQVQIKNFNYIF